MVLLSGCTQSNIVSPDSETKIADPEFGIQDDIDIDWSQVSTDADSIFEDEKTYPYSKGFHFYLEPKKKEIMLMWVVADDFPDSEIEHYADELIKGFNDVTAVQDFSIEHSSDDSFGGLWKRYGLSFSIVPESTQDDEETWFISGAFPAGTDFVLPDMSAIQDGTDAGAGAEQADPGTGEAAE